MKKIIVFSTAALMIIAAFFIGKYNGANLVRDGLVANYPLFKIIVSNTTTEKDSTITIPLNFKDQVLIFEALGLKESDSLKVTIPYHCVYGMDLNSKYFRVSQTKNLIEVYLPKSYVRSFDVNFELLTLNHKNFITQIDKKNQDEIKRAILELTTFQLSKDRHAIKAANAKIAESVMWLFMPYKFDLKMFFGNENFELPIVVGINKDVQEYIQENTHKK